MTRCDYCGRRFDRPGFYPDCEKAHPAPDLAQAIAELIEMDLANRRGCGISGIDPDIQDEIRDTWAELVRQELEKRA
jgi:hypothetical protein